MTAESNQLPDWMIAWLNSEPIRLIESQNPVLWKHILLACHQMARLEVLFHDLYKTLAGVREPESNCCANPKEPTEDVRELIGISSALRYEFKNACLTTPHLDPRRYLEALVERLRFEKPVTDEMVGELQHRLDIEQQLLYVFHEVLLVLTRLKGAYRQGLITDSMPFPVARLLTSSGLNKVLEEALVIVSSLMQVCKGSGDGTELYRKAAEAAGYLEVPFRRLGMIGDNLFRDILPALKLGFIAILLDRDYEYMDRYGEWRKLVRASSLFAPIIGMGEALSTPGTVKLGDLHLWMVWNARTGLTDLPDCPADLHPGDLQNWQVRYRDQAGAWHTERLGDVTVERAFKVGLSFADLVLPAFADRWFNERLGDLPLNCLLTHGSKLVVPYGEYLPNRQVRFRDESGNMQDATVGDISLEQAWKLGIGYGDLLVDCFDDEERPVVMRLADLPLPVLRSYDHVPAPLPQE